MLLKYWELPGLEHVYLEDSWVIQIMATPGTLQVDCEFVLTEDHTGYQPPRAGEMYCYARGALIFKNVVSLVWEQQGMPPALDAAGETDFGGIDAFSLDQGGFLLEGDFGNIRLSNDDTVSVIYSKVSTDNE